MSNNIFKTASTAKNSSNKGASNNRFSSLKDELIEQPIDNSIPNENKGKEKEKPKSRFNFDNDEVNVFAVDNIVDTREVIDTREQRDSRLTQNNTRNSFTTLRPVIKPVEVVSFVYKEESFPELSLKKGNIVTPEKISFADKLKNNEIKEEVDKMSLVEKLKLKQNEDIEENKRKEELKKIQEKKNCYVKPGWVTIIRDPITKKTRTFYGDNKHIERDKTLNEHMNYWIDGVVDRYLRRKEMLETVYGINDDYSPPEENNIDYFDMLDEKIEEENEKEKRQYINSYLNDDDDEDSDSYDSYSNDYWKKR
jgi:hypothetical protein